jgi:hypothetical protein
MMRDTRAYAEGLRPLERWNAIKKATDAADDAARLFFREGEIWWVRLGRNIGYEANGKSQEFTRPVIVLKKYNQYSFLALPLTTAAKRTERQRNFIRPLPLDSTGTSFYERNSYD